MHEVSSTHIQQAKAVVRVQHQNMFYTCAGVVEWLKKPSSSFNSVSQAKSSVKSFSATKASCFFSFFTVTPAIAPQTAPEESAEYFVHSISHLLQADE